MEHQSWVIEPTYQQFENDAKWKQTIKLKDEWDVSNERLKTKLNGIVNVPNYGEVENDGSILVRSLTLLGDAFVPLYRKGMARDITQSWMRKKAATILGYEIEKDYKTPFKKRITADTLRDAIHIFEKEYRTFLEALWDEVAEIGSRMYFVEKLEILFDDENQLHCDVQMGT